jgi:hypothetical protein
MDLHIQATPSRYKPGVGLRPMRPADVQGVPDVDGRVSYNDLVDKLPALYAALYGSAAAHARNGLNVVMDVYHHEHYPQAAPHSRHRKARTRRDPNTVRRRERTPRRDLGSSGADLGTAPRGRRGGRPPRGRDARRRSTRAALRHRTRHVGTVTGRVCRSHRQTPRRGSGKTSCRTSTRGEVPPTSVHLDAPLRTASGRSGPRDSRAGSAPHPVGDPLALASACVSPNRAIRSSTASAPNRRLRGTNDAPFGAGFTFAVAVIYVRALSSGS